MSFNIPPKIKGSIQFHRAALLTVVESAVRVSFLNAKRICAGREGEVDKVLQFFIDGTAILETGFNRILQPDGITVNIAAIFTHQTPYVEFPAGATSGTDVCELADLCILSTYGKALDRPAQGLGNALFLQAKEEFDAPPSDTQRQLYEKADRRFAYNRPRALKARAPDHRDLPPMNESALAYWELQHWGPSYWGPGPWQTVSRWSHSPDSPEPFAETLVDFLSGDCGYGFRMPSTTEHSWSRIIFDLVEETARATVKRKALKVRARLRGTGTIVRQLLHPIGGKASPFVVRNSLGKILKFYSSELGKLGEKIEAMPDALGKISHNVGGDYPERNPSGKGGDGAPPLGNKRQYEDDGNSGAGNLILIHFSEAD